MAGEAERRWWIAWLGGPFIGAANGALRDLTYQRAVGEQRGHRWSTVPAVAAFAAYFAWLERRWPLPSADAARRTGAFWLVLTVAFEFALGRGRGLTLREAAADYNLAKGRLWPIVLLWLLVGPSVVRRAARP